MNDNDPTQTPETDDMSDILPADTDDAEATDADAPAEDRTSPMYWRTVGRGSDGGRPPWGWRRSRDG